MKKPAWMVASIVLGARVLGFGIYCSDHTKIPLAPQVIRTPAGVVRLEQEMRRCPADPQAEVIFLGLTWETQVRETEWLPTGGFGVDVLTVRRKVVITLTSEDFAAAGYRLSKTGLAKKDPLKAMVLVGSYGVTEVPVYGSYTWDDLPEAVAAVYEMKKNGQKVFPVQLERKLDPYELRIFFDRLEQDVLYRTTANRW